MPSSSSPTLSPASGTRIALVVDDDATTRALAAAALARLGFEVLRAADAQDALALAAQRAVRFFMVDVQMPGEDGFWLCAQLRADERYRRTPILMMTGYDDVSAIDAAFQAGATDFIAKPLNLPLLAHRVRFIMKSADLVDEIEDNRRKLDEALDLAQLGHWSSNLATRTLTLSPSAMRLFGLSVDSTGNTKPIARRSSRVGDGQALKRTFNYEGNGQVIWFEVTSSSKFRIKTAGERKNHCEVYRFESDGRQTRLTTSKPGEMTCNQVLSLTKGHHSLQLFEGLSGIETVTIEEESGGSLFSSSKAPTSSIGLSSCHFETISLSAGNYRLSSTRSAALRGLTIVSLPVSASTSLHLTLEPQATLAVPLAPGAARMVRTVGGPALSCTLNKTALPSNEGACALPALKDTQTLTLTNPGTRAITVSMGAEGTLSASPAPLPFTPTLAPITQVKAGESAFFDFAKGQSHSVLFEVTNPGLYSATTQGLLSTSCMLRTAVAPNFANDSGSGRGRNCLIATSLQKGRYLMTATTTGESRGRAALALNRRGPREAQTQTGESEAFFRVEPDELIQQTLNIPSTGEWKLSTSGQGQTLQCRLDDAQGWPLETVPSQCTGQRMMKAGQYKWSQFPLTVESMRHTSLQKVRPAVVLKGKAAHQVEFFNWYDAELGDDGKDEFLFSLSGDTTIDVVLTGGMQGRVYRLEGTVAKPVEVIPAMESSNQNRNENGEGEAGEGDGESENTNQGDEGEYSEGEGDSEGSEDRAPAAVEQPKVAQVPPPPHGAQIALPAGSYRIITEHSRGDVGISYRLHLGSLTLLPGMKRTVPVPSTMSIVVPADGTLRLKTQGEADVRCRLFDANGVRVLENGDNGSDWNCAIAEPVAKGTYRLDLESEVQRPGETLISLAVPPTEDKGALTDGSSTKLQEAVATFALPTASDDTVHDLVFTSTSGLFSCAVENELGAVEARQLRSKRCALLIRPGSRKYRVRLWSNEGSPEVKTSLTSRTSKPLPIANAGRYSVKTAANCINGSEFGAMSNCWPEVSLEAGSAMFSVTGSANLPSMAELTATGSESPLNVSLNRRAFIQRLTAPAPSLFLMRATAPHGSAVTPACAFDGVTGGRESRSRECFAVSKVGTEATGRTWVTAGNDLTVALTRQAISLPGSAESLATGRRHVTFSKTALFSLNPSTARLRVSVTLPKDGWAVLLGDNDVPLDVCAPSDTMRTCILTAGKSRLVLSATAGEADLNVTQLESEPRSTAFTGLFEFEAREPGSVQLPFTAQQENRSLTVQGALACALVLDNGARIEECRTTVSGGRSGTLFIEYDTGAIRAVLSTSAKVKATRFGLEAPLIPAAGLNVSVATALSGSRVDRTLVVSKDSVVRIAAASGVCALFKGTELLAVDGFNSGCEIIRVLGAGNYRVLVRPFADVALSGLLSWSAEAVTALTEGVGAETWVSPGEVKVYRFTTEAPGKVGFGVQVARDSLECSILDERYETVGEGCQQYLSLKKGAYLLLLKQPQRAVTPIAVKPVLLGLSGDQNQVPPEFLKDFFNRIRSN